MEIENEIKYRKKILDIRKKAHANKDMTVDMGRGKGSYAARSEESVLNILQPLLDDKMIDVVCIGVTVVDHSPSHFKAIYTYKFIDCETGHFETVVYAGSGTDKADKDTGKAGTYAFKNMLIKRFFMVSGEDAENESSDKMSNNIHSELTENFKQLISLGYFNSRKMNPQQTEAGYNEAINAEEELIKNHVHDVSWLMNRNKMYIDLINKVHGR